MWFCEGIIIGKFTACLLKKMVLAPFVSGPFLAFMHTHLPSAYREHSTVSGKNMEQFRLVLNPSPAPYLAVYFQVSFFFLWNLID